MKSAQLAGCQTRLSPRLQHASLTSVTVEARKCFYTLPSALDARYEKASTTCGSPQPAQACKSISPQPDLPVINMHWYISKCFKENQKLK